MNDRLSAGLKPIIVTNGKVVLPDQMVEAAVAVVDGRVDAILTSEAAVHHWIQQHADYILIDADQNYVLPGLIDIHCDAIEKEIQPRPNTLFPLDMALLEFERKLPLHGITTMYHSLSLGVGLSLRGDHLLTGMVEHINSYRSKRSIIRNRIHLRFEVSHLAGMPIVERYLNENAIDYLSFMDHSPGQGQYREPGSFERYVMKNQGVGVEEVRAIVEDLVKRRQLVNGEHLLELSKLAAQRGIAIASHDDDSIQKVEESAGYGVSVCEFPINLETAKHAAERGLRVCVGAPNVVRGASHDKNLRAVDAISVGAADILCSDYHPSSMLAAVFKLADEGIAALPDAVRMASLHPAQALGAGSELGSIELGKAADLIIVDRYDGLPWVTNTIVGGQVVYTSAVRY
ncbi:alpha-D-ribose 1-methylphosphonate 5-triphosphate diphosphatase [Paenibacillus sp. PL91]|uniref:alpha-D-ribose 1-methylphosphonate 5-triphosphate diphosphatase n=1 Tax=Paenibacillus sp. PL91 TaxID=2729538 RepID=UPI00145D5388|nr:alpha-D-ribose 1-methylphosphonate 5-triphosphate diphosphatase [Paenibacillus sp. PL91]MBC9204825.1 alpha-D-ribose 1-methylphosphonate 5-triphosphate diphosphatase [Paenibacillus sp. PL91]